MGSLLRSLIGFAQADIRESAREPAPAEISRYEYQETSMDFRYSSIGRRIAAAAREGVPVSIRF
jgi:hypothetical protein